jgi:hypothetical protein
MAATFVFGFTVGAGFGSTRGVSGEFSATRGVLRTRGVGAEATLELLMPPGTMKGFWV